MIFRRFDSTKGICRRVQGVLKVMKVSPGLSLTLFALFRREEGVAQGLDKVLDCTPSFGVAITNKHMNVDLGDLSESYLSQVGQQRCH